MTMQQVYFKCLKNPSYLRKKWRLECTQKDFDEFMMLDFEKIGDVFQDERYTLLSQFVKRVIHEYYVGDVLIIDLSNKKDRQMHFDPAQSLERDIFIYVNGDFHTLSVCLSMCNGVVYIDGSVDARVGSFMSGGFVYVNGDVDGDVGMWMEGGVIVGGCWWRCRLWDEWRVDYC